MTKEQKFLRDNYKSFGRCICLVDQNIEENGWAKN